MTASTPRLGRALGLLACALVAAAACEPRERREADRSPAPGGDTIVDWSAARERMVREQIVARGIADPRVVAALQAEPRHEYVPVDERPQAYADRPLAIGYDQTISQPYIVALMSEALEVGPTHRVLEIGTGSGYQAAILDRLGAEVYSIEIVTPLCERARKDLARLGHARVRVRCGDGYAGWPEAGPFDRIVLTAAPPEVPRALLDQLAPDGRLVAPVGVDTQHLVLLTRGADGRFLSRILEWVRFVPMVHEPGDR